jgi:polyisoprenoid-binding protein YceI
MTHYVLDPDRTRIGFVAAHRVGNKVHGRFTAFEGAVHLDESEPSASDAWITVQLDSVETGNPQRDAQLRKNFFDTTSHPTMTFVTTRIVPVSDDHYDVTGDLTIRGKTHPLTTRLALDPTNTHFTSSATLNRHTWTANWNTFTKALVHPTVQLDLSLTLTPRPTPPFQDSLAHRTA